MEGGWRGLTEVKTGGWRVPRGGQPDSKWLRRRETRAERGRGVTRDVKAGRVTQTGDPRRGPDRQCPGAA